MFNIPSLSSDILALSFDAKSSPSLDLHLPELAAASHSQGWGLGWYPDDQSSAMVTKDPGARSKKVPVASITDWGSFRSTVFFCKVRGAENGYGHADAQPFARSFAGRDWLFMHNGDLEKPELEKLHGTRLRMMEPLGSTDSELAFCNLLTQVQETNARRIADVDAGRWLEWFQRFDRLGSSDMYISDGESILVFHGSKSPKNLYYSRVQPPDNKETLSSPAVDLSLNDPRDNYRSALIVSSSPFNQREWVTMEAAQLIIIRRSVIVWNSHQDRDAKLLPVTAPAKPWPASPARLQQAPQQETPTQIQGEQAQVMVLNARSVIQTLSGHPLHYRMYEVIHATEYEYENPVEHSTHTFRLQPTDDWMQQVENSKLTISSPMEDTHYEDVFGNQVMHAVISKTYKRLAVTATSLVKVYALPPDDHNSARRQTTIPLVWMPWQRQMMTPYLLPEELPESQLTELTEYAMSFVQRNDYHLMKTIKDVNLSIFRDFEYATGSTLINTSPFTVYASRKGVCQDFANLFICLMRLLGIPARYRMGYIYTGKTYDNKVQSDASHAWAEVYLPYVGWRGFDPTNGCVAGQDHIRVAAGRNYRDATPTAGTIYKGGGKEILEVAVQIREVFMEPTY